MMRTPQCFSPGITIFNCNFTFSEELLSLEDKFLTQANSLKDSITSAQLQALLEMEFNMDFNMLLCDELVQHFGTSNTIYFDDFWGICFDLQKRKVKFANFIARNPDTSIVDLQEAFSKSEYQNFDQEFDFSLKRVDFADSFSTRI